MSDDTYDHIRKVQAALEEIRACLAIRAAHHDDSKLHEPELSGYAALQAAMAGVAYGTDAYRVVLQQFAPIVQHHYAHNSHHPEHYANGVAGMSLLDLIEMFCDWRGASQRPGAQGGVARSIEVNQRRLDPQLVAIFQNTLRELGWE